MRSFFAWMPLKSFSLCSIAVLQYCSIGMRSQRLQSGNRDRSPSQQGSRLLFVYGTLMRRLKLDVHLVLARQAVYVHEATMQGVLFSAGKFPAAVLSDRPDHTVVGEVYRMHDPIHLFAMLDSYEDFKPNDEASSLFVRRHVNVRLHSAVESQAWVYLYNRSLVGLQVIAGGDYAQHVRGGLRHGS